MVAGEVRGLSAGTVVHLRGARNQSEDPVHADREPPTHPDPHKDYHRRGPSIKLTECIGTQLIFLIIAPSNEIRG